MDLYCIERGRGDAVVLLHGGLASHTAIWQFAAPLAERFRVITPDLRAAGRSVWTGELSWDLLADDVAELVRGLGLERAAIGGISFGAAVAVRVALRHPAITRALIVLHPAYAGAAIGLTAAQLAAMRAMDAVGSRAVAEGIDVLLPLFDALPESVRERARRLVATYDAASVATTTRFMASGAQPFARGEELAAIAAPALVVPGVDAQHPREVAEVYARYVPRCTVRDTPDLAAAIGDFLSGA
jgi:pimeloyl-ACP methyl ester carboxylesterase